MSPPLQHGIEMLILVRGLLLATERKFPWRLLKARRTKTGNDRSEPSSTGWCLQWPERIPERFLRKGSRVYVEGQLQTRKWTDAEGDRADPTMVVLGKALARNLCFWTKRLRSS
jgi:hypothetical protein